MSHIKSHTRKTKQGKIIYVKAHDDKRNKKPHHGTPKRHVIKAPDPGMVKMRKMVTGLLRTEEGRQEFIEKIKAGGFQNALPEVGALYGVEQGAHHPLPDAFDHTMELFKYLPVDASENILWAALLHDIGKVETQDYHDTRGIVFDGHEYHGYKMSKDILKRLGFKRADADEISYMILHHGNLRTQLLRRDDEKAKKFIEHPHFDSLLTLHNADVLASGRDPHEVLERVKELEKMDIPGKSKPSKASKKS